MGAIGRLTTLLSILVLATGAPVLAEREPGVTSSDPCPAENLVADITPADATGSTFVGTYAGDTTSDRGMTIFWSVERVYAGEEITNNLFFHTSLRVGEPDTRRALPLQHCRAELRPFG